MIRKLSFTALALLSCTAAVAAPDSRIRSVAYDPNEIVRILGKAGIQSTIQFAADEQIENVAVGDSSAWQITPNRRASLLFVKPLSAHSRTNMTVVTDKRTYMFDLVAGDRSTTPLYAMKFSYPHDKAPPPVAASAQQAAAAKPTVETPAMVAERLHFDWNSKGNAKVIPGRVFDDGTALYLAWSRETPLPAILTVSEDRKEGPLNYRMSGEYIVISPVPQNIVLRYGSKSAALWPSRRIVPVPTQGPSALPPRMAASVSPQQAPIQTQPPQVQPSQPAPVASAPATVKLADVSTLFTDKLTDDRHEQ
jgi:type IV secretion system protein VirB9